MVFKYNWSYFDDIFFLYFMLTQLYSLCNSKLMHINFISMVLREINPLSF